MLTKKLVIAALVAAAQADTTTDGTGTDTTGTGTDTTGTGTDSTGTDTSGTDTSGTDTTGDSTGTGSDTTGTGTGTGTGGDTTEADKGAKGDDSDDFDFEEARKEWREQIGQDSTGKDILRVLCDQGESAIWEEAQDQFKDLEKRLADQKAYIVEIKTEYDPLNDALTEAQNLAAEHKNNNAAFLQAWTDADAEVTRLQTAAGGSDQTAAMQLVLNGVVETTTAAETAVDTQRGRVEALITAKRTQDQEEALWEERVAAAQLAVQAATTAKEAADDAVTDAQSQVTTRSWLFEVLAHINATEWAAACNSGSNPRCQLTESARADTSSSTWSWPSAGNCNYTTGSGLNQATHNCLILGLSGTGAGLIQSATAAKGTARVTTGTPAAPTELFAAYETADYTYTSSATQLSGSDSNIQAIALDTYEKWQQKNLLATMQSAACWRDGTNSGAFQASDQYTWCTINNGLTGSEKFNPLLQSVDVAGTLVKNALDAETLRGTFGDADSNDTAITVARQVARAKAQVNLWFADWLSTALDEDWVLTGKEANRSTEAGATWQGRTLGAAELTQTTKVALLAAAEKEHAATVAWEAAAAAEAAAANTDLEKARDLLADLTAEIAPVARMEIDARNNLQAAIDAEALRVAAAQELGTDAVAAVGNTPAVEATGARAVLAAALVTKQSVEAQQEFHDARVHWAEDSRAPRALQLAQAQELEADLQAAHDAAEAKFDAAREACKVAAFEKAQEAREEAVQVAAARKDKADKVLSDYTALSKFPTDGSVGTLCHYPKTAADAPQEDRAECAEGEPGAPLCCGAAQRFLKDGTKLSIETCQLATATTYSYYPALPTGAVVAPTAETWRFQCISAAQKLAAAATAALAAGYMMA